MNILTLTYIYLTHSMNILTLTFIIVISIVPYILSIAALIIALVALNRTRRALPAPAPALAPDAPPPEILAAIAAAVSIVCGPNARIADVQPAGILGGTAQPWALEGRRAIHSTRRPR